jgi:lipopolysaccharide transport system ATP-binding protein
MTDTIIKAENVGKKFSKSLKRSMLYGITDVMTSAIGLKSDSGKLRQGEFWALQDISFELRKGETLGIIGSNGSGKSTMLKMLNGIYMPDSGKITIDGRVGALIEVGAGFHPMLSGRENIYINGAILGMSKREIDEKLDDIITFADIGDFIDSPVKYYSSGMYVRLGFSIAININPEILLIDEILSVGDLSFQNKSLRKLAELRDKAHAVIFVGHNLRHVENLCDRVIVLNKGKQEFIGEAKEGIMKYQELSRKSSAYATNQKISSNVASRISSVEEIEFIDCGFLDADGHKTLSITIYDPLNQFCDFRLNRDVEGLNFSLGIIDEMKRVCLWAVNTDDPGIRYRNLKKGVYRIMTKYDQHCLMPGIYIPNVAIRNDITGETYERIISSEAIAINGDVVARGLININKQWSICML